ncbi:Hint domain-containing protein [Streptomyces sp. B5E4]|uniref:Hint domain-containing protein n=1 Tax=Streptomyces sp. B5E4 TaxID=3153568 RepID=UPI00325EAC70
MSCGSGQTRADGSRGNGMSQTGGGVMGRPSVSHPWCSNCSSQSPAQTIDVEVKDNELWIEGIRLPAAQELEFRYAQYDTDDDKMRAWANSTCSGSDTESNVKGFCSAAEKLGLWDTSPPPGAGIVLAIVAPDVESLKKCGKAMGLSLSCLSAALDAPWAKPLKSFKALKAAKKCHSFFAAGTRVLLADGGSKRIEDLEIGDRIVVIDPETGKTKVREIVATITTEDDKDFVDLKIKTDGRTATLASTTTHPFWVQEKNAWVNAGDLTPGYTLRTPDGTTATIHDVRHYTQRQRTHGLTVNGTHTYHVLAGETPVLVHNSSCSVVPYDADFAMGQLTRNGTAKASELEAFGAAQGWTRTQTASGPIKFRDDNGKYRLTIKRGSGRAPGSSDPHVEMRNADGDRIDSFGNVVTRKSPGNHTPIDWDLE